MFESEPAGGRFRFALGMPKRRAHAEGLNVHAPSDVLSDSKLNPRYLQSYVVGSSNLLCPTIPPHIAEKPN